jgi:hypothetical protein
VIKSRNNLNICDVLFDPFFEIIINIEPGGKWIDGAKRIFQDLFEKQRLLTPIIYTNLILII